MSWRGYRSRRHLWVSILLDISKLTYIKPAHDLVLRALSEGAFDHGGRTKPKLERSFLGMVAVGSIFIHHSFNPVSTIQAYKLLMDVVDDTGALDLQKVRKIHNKLLENSSWANGFYMKPGETRTSTGKTVVVGAPPIKQRCPYKEVDEELNLIID